MKVKHLSQYINFNRVLKFCNKCKFVKLEHNHEHLNILYIKNLQSLKKLTNFVIALTKKIYYRQSNCLLYLFKLFNVY